MVTYTNRPPEPEDSAARVKVPYGTDLKLYKSTWTVSIVALTNGWKVSFDGSTTLVESLAEMLNAVSVDLTQRLPKIVWIIPQEVSNNPDVKQWADYSPGDWPMFAAWPPVPGVQRPNEGWPEVGPSTWLAMKLKWPPTVWVN